MRKKAEQPWEYARKGGTLGGTESVLFRVFTGISVYFRVTDLKIYFHRFNHLHATADGGHGVPRPTSGVVRSA
jgi:hypothetical protein